ncbi:MAG: hypothetical protein QW255_01450 [Candidatus Bilamarchaeaceae archaeon]
MKYNRNMKLIEFKKKVENTKNLGKDIKKQEPLLSEVLKREDTFVEKRVVLAYIKKHNLVVFSNELIRLYVKEKDKYIKSTILETLKNWFESKKLNKIPKALSEGIKKNKKDYYYLFYFLAEFSPSLFANKTINLLNEDSIDVENKIYLHLLIENLTKKYEVEIKSSCLSKRLFKTTERLVELKKYLELKQFLIDGVLEKKMREIYIDATITADIIKHYKLQKNDYAPIFFLLDTLLELKFFAPAVDLIMNSQMEDREKVPTIVQIYNYIEKVNNVLNLPNKEKLIEIQKKLYNYLLNKNIVPFLPNEQRKS